MGRYRLRGHTVRWQVGPVMANALEELERELQRIAQSPDSLVPDRETGIPKLIACIIEPEQGCATPM